MLESAPPDKSGVAHSAHPRPQFAWPCGLRYLRTGFLAPYAVIAQLVERIHGKDEVPGSIPGNGSIDLQPIHNPEIYAPRKRNQRLSLLQGVQDAELHNPHQQEDNPETGAQEILLKLQKDDDARQRKRDQA